MKGYKTTPCVICGKIHDTAANCPSHQAICPLCQKLVMNQTEKSG
ncbi:hypothetical protein [Anaerobacillus arseniciselenatis]|nr:hypothetical protein [Anaerobacillus arseniciselenatis]